MGTEAGAARSQIGGAVHQQRDDRDYDFDPPPQLLRRAARVTNHDLCESGFMPPVWDQGHYESCVAHAVAAAWAVAEARTLGLPPGRPSRLFIWHEGCRIQHRKPKDPIDLRAAFYAVTKTGVPDEALWVYSRQNITKKPPQRVYDAAKKLPGVQ